jgi:hypothetical protein
MLVPSPEATSMAIVSKPFSTHEHGMGDQDRYSLVRDTQTGHIFILHEWLHRRGQAVAYGKVEIELDAFFAMHGAAQDKLHQLIDTLVEE